MSAAPYRLGFIGAGKLAGSVIRGLLLKKFCTPDAILASEPNVETRAQLENELGHFVDDREQRDRCESGNCFSWCETTNGAGGFA